MDESTNPVGPAAAAPVTDPTTGPCPWPINVACDSKWVTYPADMQERAARIATQVLWAFTGRRFGICTLTIRPCSMPQRCGRWTPWFGGPFGTSTLLSPWVDQYGQWRNGCGGCRGECGCSELCMIRLENPVYRVTEVMQNGAVVPDTAWVVYDTDQGPRIVRTDGGCWLDCQELKQPDDGPHALAVTYERGEVPAGAAEALGTLASEIAKACMNQACRLPSRVSQVVREGITYSFIDPLSMFKDARVGIPEVDMWIASVNPYSIMRPGAVFSPDVRRGYQVRQSNPSPWRGVL